MVIDKKNHKNYVFFIFRILRFVSLHLASKDHSSNINTISNSSMKIINANRCVWENLFRNIMKKFVFLPETRRWRESRGRRCMAGGRTGSLTLSKRSLSRETLKVSWKGKYQMVYIKWNIESQQKRYKVYFMRNLGGWMKRETSNYQMQRKSINLNLDKSTEKLNFNTSILNTKNEIKSLEIKQISKHKENR